MLQVHDFPDPAAHSPERDETISPLQSLFAINSPFVKARALEVADQIKDESNSITKAYNLLFQREPTALEREAGTQFLKTAPLDEYARVLLASNEFLFVD